jgi:hypothetical protein
VRHSNRIIGWVEPRLKPDGTISSWSWRTLGGLHKGNLKTKFKSLAEQQVKLACGWGP